VVLDFFVNVTLRMTLWSHGFGVGASVAPPAIGIGDAEEYFP
jgi:hypothetical protein